MHSRAGEQSMGTSRDREIRNVKRWLPDFSIKAEPLDVFWEQVKFYSLRLKTQIFYGP